MKKNLRTYLELSWWIILAVISLTPKAYDKSTMIIGALYALVALIWILAADSIYQVVQMLRGRYRVPYSEAIVYHMIMCGYYTAARQVMEARNRGEILTPQQLTVLAEQHWKYMKIKTPAEVKQEEKEMIDKAVEELLK